MRVAIPRVIRVNLTDLFAGFDVEPSGTGSSKPNKTSVLPPDLLVTAYGSMKWCPRRDSNPEPTDYESAALTVELQGHKDLQRSAL